MEVRSQRLEFPRKLLFFLNQYAPIKCAYGGRNGIKSWSIAQALILKASQSTKRIVCGREIQNSIADSVHQLLVDQINRMGLAGKFIITDVAIICRTTMSTFVFKGIKTNIDSIKSLEGADILWMEEAAKTSKSSWDKILPTMRKPGCEIWVSYNPDEEDDPTHQLMVVNPYPGAIVVKTGWQDNKWMTPEMHNLRRYMQKVDPDNYDHVWEGECKKRSKSQILSGKWRIGTREEMLQAELAEGQTLFGADWGFSQDPTTLMRVRLVGARLYITHEVHEVGLELSDTAPKFLAVPGAGTATIKGDSARPETISYLRNGQPATATRDAVPPLNVEGVDKWKGSVEDGIAFLRSLEEIIISPDCPKTAEEARKWSYKIDSRTEAIQAEVADGWDHCWDAVRYALDQIIKTSTRNDGMLRYFAELFAKAEAEKLAA